MPGSAPAGWAAYPVPVVPASPDESASPGPPAADAGTANERIRTTIAMAVAGAADRRRDIVVAFAPCQRDRAGYRTVPPTSTQWATPGTNLSAVGGRTTPRRRAHVRASRVRARRPARSADGSRVPAYAWSRAAATSHRRRR